MQIILQEDVEKLGHRGDVVTVKPGYARNFLLPQKLAVEATAGNLKAIERIRTSLAKENGHGIGSRAETGRTAQWYFTEVHAQDRGERPDVRFSHLRGYRGRIGWRRASRSTSARRSLAKRSRTIGEFPVTIKVFRDVNRADQGDGRKRTRSTSMRLEVASTGAQLAAPRYIF